MGVRIIYILGLLLLSAVSLVAQQIDTNYTNFEPYSPLKARFCGTMVKESPDPLIAYKWSNPKSTDNLEIYNLLPVKVSTDKPTSFINLGSLTTSNPDVTVSGTGNIILDFGCESAGWIEFDSDDLVDSVEMSISEYNEPAVLNKGAQNPFKTKTPVRYGNTYRLELNKELYEGVRFAWIHVKTFTKTWHIKKVRFVCQIKPVNYNGSFSCSDPELTKIWYAGAYVVKLNLLKDYFGAILMERSDRYSWTGDAYPSQAASLVAFSNYDFVRTNIINTSTQSNGIASYPLYWVLSLIDYINYSGDTMFLGSLLSNACSKLDTAYNHYGKNPSLDFYGWDERLGAGFENPDCKESQNAYKMLSIRVWNEFALMMKNQGKTDLYNKYKNYADEKIAELRLNKDWHMDFGVHSAADAINAGFTHQKEENDLFVNEFSDRLNRISYSPFNQYFIINAMSIIQKYDDAICAVKDCWGGQLKYGGTTFFEVYRPSWNDVLNTNDAPPNNQCGYTSLAHPWGAGVTKWLTEEILGIKPTAPGFSTFNIIPHLGRTLTSVEGKVLTPHGEISASFNLSSRICKINVPSGTICKIGIPKNERVIEKIIINNNLAWENKYLFINGIESAYEDSNYVYFTNVKAGNYYISVSYNGTTSPVYSNNPAWNYSAKFVKEDSSTQGNWGKIYGNDGYYLCNYFGNDSNISVLPDYVKSITFKKNVNYNFAKGISDKRALAPNEQNGFPRNVGAICTKDYRACYQTMTADIIVDGTKNYQVALYFVDWDNKNRRVAVEMFDLKTLKIIAPVKIVRDFNNGKYLVFEYNKSVRFRINQVRGVNACINGIFFDKGIK